MSAEFIKLVSELHTERFNMRLAELMQKKTPCGVFLGFGFATDSAAANIQMLIKTGLNLTCAIVLVENQINLLKPLTDVPIIKLEELSSQELKPQTVFIPDSIKDTSFTPYFAARDVEVIFLHNAHQQGNRFLDTMKHLPELYSVYEMLGSEESKKVFCAAIKGNLTGKIGDYRFATEPQYFLKGFTPRAGDIAIDGGAYDGITAIGFAKCGAKVFAFEMDADNYSTCAARLEQFDGYGITLENLGLSDKETVENYWAWGTGSRKAADGTSKANFTDLDTYVARNEIPYVDYIKLDIEGAELDMLHGAAKTITRCKPKMAISAYHKPEDLWTLAPYIKSLRADYEFEFRHYKIDCTNYTLNDLERAVLKYFRLSYLVPTYCEMVLYCR